LKKGTWDTEDCDCQIVAVLVLDLPWQHLNCVIKCLQPEQKGSDYFPLTVDFAICAVEAHAYIVMMQKGWARLSQLTQCRSHPRLLWVLCCGWGKIADILLIGTGKLIGDILLLHQGTQIT